ncbi:MAG TPA: adenylosuccinate lyase, partial [Thermoproteota archaeon]|nr:adenylosuccinate lyase [Thermoproteota archaeon]
MSTSPEAIHPLDYRYGDAKVKHAFSQLERFRLILEFEGRVAEVQSELGIIPQWAGPAISKAAKAGISLEKIRETEKETQHEAAAVVACLEEAAGEAGRFVHFGLTSNDALDTVTFMQVSKAGERILELTRDLIDGLVKRAEENRHLLCVARTHGMHAEPYTYGLRFAVWSSELVRCYLRFSDALSQARVGKVSGAVGDYSALGEKGPELERRVLASFGLKPLTPATQVIPRDVLASMLLQLTTLSSVLDRIATNLRNLHRTEVGEVRESWTEGQVGSSAMPHKRNPIGCEKVSGLARIVRSLALASLENIVLWDERDLTNSSAERAIVP